MRNNCHLFGSVILCSSELLWFLNDFEGDLHVILRDRKPRPKLEILKDNSG